MRLKGLMATSNLGWHLVLRLLKRLFLIRSPGLEGFIEFYRPDRIAPLTTVEKQLLTEAGWCVSCGLCDSHCPGTSLLPHFSRSIPDFAGVALPAARACAGCEAICPEGVPLTRIGQFMKNKRVSDS